MSSNSTVSRRRLLEASTGTISIVGIGANSVSAQDERVVFNVGYQRESGRQSARDAAADIVREFAFNALTIEASEQAAQGLRQRPDIRYVEENAQMEAFDQTVPWGIDRIDADVAHDANETGSGARISIIDTGIDATHEDLAANLGEGVAIVECSEDCDEPWDDDNGHGTHVAGTAGAVDNDRGVIGTAPESTVHAVKVLNDGGAGTFSDIAAGIEWTADQGHDVATLSLGASSGSETVRDACQYADERGVFLVAAAGNSGPCTDCVAYPAAYDECLAVSATDSEDNLASFSSTGPEIELAAPGASILSTVPDNNYVRYSGTSMATPHVAGAAGILMTNGYSHTEARIRLTETAEDIGLDDTEQGSGLVDVNAAVNTTSEDIITLDGYEDQDEIADYTFLVDGSVKKSTAYGGTINSSDEINGSVVTGRTRKQADSYQIDGEIVAFSADGPIDVFRNGEEIDPSQFDDTILTLDGDETQNVIAEYTFTVEGDVEKSTRYDGTINGSDAITGSVITGRTRKQADSYQFEGRITAFSAAGPIDVFLNGEPIDPSQFDDTILTLDGNETQDVIAEYTFAVEGNLEKSTRYDGTINDSDNIYNWIATGRTRKQADSYQFEGRITAFSATGPIDVFLNGEPIDPSQFDDTILTLDGHEDQDEIANYEFEYIGSVEKSTRYGGTINNSDEIHDGYVTGKTRKQPDSYRFEGRITSFSVDGPVDVFFNGTFIGSTAPF